MNLLCSLNHNIYGITVDKTTLIPLDTNRYIDNDGITTYPHGYHTEE